MAPQTYLTPLLNRNYVSPKLFSELEIIAEEFNDRSNLKVVYLDANFPFLNKFPLLPHLSHDDGKKIDLSFAYNINGKLSNLKPSTTGYGIFVEPKKGEVNQTVICKMKGRWQYDYSKLFTLGSRDDLVFNRSKTRELINIILGRGSVEKIFIEPHLKSRLNITSEKVRFQGCHAVRHDDHIHLQIN